MKHTKCLLKVKQSGRFSRLGNIAAIGFLLFQVKPGIAQTPQTQILQEWTSKSGSQNTFQRSVIRSKVLAGNTYYYQAGATINSSGNYDMLVEKMSASGSLIWAKTYNGAGNGDDIATDVQIDAIGNVYICGTYYKNSTDSNNAIIIKYNDAGTQKWTYTYNGPGSRHDGLTSIYLATSNAVVAVGTAWGGSTTQYDFLQLRVDSSGSQVWATTWDYSNMNDVATNFYFSSGKYYAAGGAQSASTTYKYAVLNITAATGAVNNSTVTGGTGFGIDKLTDMETDAAGNIYVTGGVYNGLSTLYDFKTIKLDTALNIVWSATYNGSSSLDDIATGLCVDSLNNVIVTGYTNTTTQGKNFATIKYNSSGTQQWAVTFNGTANGNDSATAIVTAGTNIYVTGASYNGQNNDYYTLKYDDSGNLKWGIAYNGNANQSDRPTAIAVDTSRGIIVTGQSATESGGLNFMTVKYVEKSVLIPTSSESLLNSFAFTENRGQLLGDDNKACNQIKFYNKEDGSKQQIYVADNALYYVWTKLDTAQTSPQDSIYRLDMSFTGGNVNQKIYALDQRTDYINYFLSYLSEPYVKVKTYNKLFSPDIYSNIDLQISSNASGMKYYYIVKPGGNPSDIQEHYNGYNSLTTNGNGDIVISTDLGDLTHPQATVWEIDGSGNVTSLAWHPDYSISGSDVGFSSFGSYDVTQTLIIEVKNGSSVLSPDPTDNLEWATHYGSTAGGTSFNAIALNNDGAPFTVGSCSGTNFPTLNAIVGTALGQGDAVMVGFDTSAARLFATYYGGPGIDDAKDIVFDSIGNFYFCGQTTSSTLWMPSTQPPGAYVDASYNGGSYDWFIGKIDFTGTVLQWATFYGSSGSDQATGIYYDKSHNHLYVIGYAGSGFPLRTKANAWNSSTGGGAIAEFDNSLDTSWVTLFAGIPNDIVGNGEGFYMVGYTGTSAGLPTLNPQNGAYYDSSSVNTAFISSFSLPNDTLIWSTGFGGNGIDYAWGAAISGKDLYVCGRTESSGSTFPIYYQPGMYIDSLQTGTGQSDAWIARFGPTGVRKWCTLYGGTGQDAFKSIGVAADRNIYALGTCGSTNQELQTNGNAYYQTLYSTGYNDDLIVGFSQYNVRTWATYFGGIKGESSWTSSAAVYGSSKLYIVGYSPSDASTFPWDYPTGGWIDTLKPNTIEPAAFIARFGIDNLATGIYAAPENGNSDLLIYPNPSSEAINVVMDGANGNIVTVEIYDMLGQLVINRNFGFVYGTLHEQLDVSSLSNGVYLVTVQLDNGTVVSRKISIQR